MSAILSVIMLGLRMHLAVGRSWTDVPGMSPLAIPSDPEKETEATESEHRTAAPSAAPTTSRSPSEAPTFSPAPSLSLVPSLSIAPSLSTLPSLSLSPTAHPTFSPSGSPTVLPTDPPSSLPSDYPTLDPTNFPTIAPTPNIWIENSPIVKFDGYFNYDTHFANPYRPLNWGNVDATKTPEYHYWKQFQDAFRRDLTSNRCGSHSKRQSPIDVSLDKVNAECLEYHEVRHQKGDFPVDHPLVMKQILPGKLRVVYPRRDPNNPDLIDPPSADVPKGWGSQLDVIHADLKFPSEHTINGTRFAGEWQIFMLQMEGRGAPAMSILIDRHPEDRNNTYFHKALREWDKVWHADELSCQLFQQTQRRLRASWIDRGRRLFNNKNVDSDFDVKDGLRNHFSTWADEPAEYQQRMKHRIDSIHEDIRRDQSANPWDPFHNEHIMRSPWFYGYWGSTTEPPCYEFVQWHVVDEPMYLSNAQIFDLKRILFNHRDSRCQYTSNHYRGSVARPLQSQKDRELWKCNCVDYISDAQRKYECRKRCTQPIGGKCGPDWLPGQPWTNGGDDDDDAAADDVTIDDGESDMPSSVPSSAPSLEI